MPCRGTCCTAQTQLENTLGHMSRKDSNLHLRASVGVEADSISGATLCAVNGISRENGNIAAIPGGEHEEARANPGPLAGLGDKGGGVVVVGEGERGDTHNS